eukprot:scaffold7042_cov401-Pinguiococcus_pyrenoidosus.AAC.2
MVVHEPDQVSQLVDGHVLDEAEPLVVDGTAVLVGRREVREDAAQRGHQLPDSLCRAPWIDVPEVQGERRTAGLVIHARANDLERHEQALVVLDDLRLTRGQAQVEGRAEAAVLDQDRQIERDARFDDRGEGVIGEDVSLPEVGDEELRIRAHSNRVRREDRDNLGSVDLVAKGAAHVVARLDDRRRFRERDDQPGAGAGALRSEGAVAIDAGEATQTGLSDHEEIRRRVRRVIRRGDADGDLDVRERRGSIVHDLEGAFEANARKGELLGDLNAHWSADTGTALRLFALLRLDGRGPRIGDTQETCRKDTWSDGATVWCVSRGREEAPSRSMSLAALT